MVTKCSGVDFSISITGDRFEPKIFFIPLELLNYYIFLNVP